MGRGDAFVGRMLENRPFLAEFVPFATRLAADGRRIALGQTLLKLTCPGVPDIYQGDELWSFALVDPDNRRPVDWERRRLLLAKLKAGAAVREETEKLYLIWRTLELRARRTAAFEAGYEPVEAGPDVCAFMRGAEVLVAVPLRSGATFDPPIGFRDVLESSDLGVFLFERS